MSERFARKEHGGIQFRYAVCIRIVSAVRPEIIGIVRRKGTGRFECRDERQGELVILSVEFQFRELERSTPDPQ